MAKVVHSSCSRVAQRRSARYINSLSHATSALPRQRSSRHPGRTGPNPGGRVDSADPRKNRVRVGKCWGKEGAMSEMVDRMAVLISNGCGVSIMRATNVARKVLAEQREP